MHPALGVVVEQGGGHLAAAGVVHAHEQDLGGVLHQGSLALGEGAQALSGEAVHEQEDEVDHPGPGQAVD